MATITDTLDNLLTFLCECITSFTVDNPDYVAECDCFNGKNPDLCCNAQIIWAVQNHCSGPWVRFTSIDAEQDSFCAPGLYANYELGFAFCPPDDNDKQSTKDKYATCLSTLLDQVMSCVSSELACRKDITVSSVVALVDGFVISVRMPFTYVEGI